MRLKWKTLRVNEWHADKDAIAEERKEKRIEIILSNTLLKKMQIIRTKQLYNE